MTKNGNGLQWAKGLAALTVCGLFTPLAHAAGCGVYTPSVYIAANADAGEIATATYGMPGQDNVFAFDEYTLFMDVWGSRALANCLPLDTLSPNDKDAQRQNFYNANGMLAKQYSTINTSGLPVTKNYTYSASNALRLTSSQVLCTFDSATQFYNITLTYDTNGRLANWRLIPDAQCYDQTSYSVTYSYGNALAPRMPTTILTASTENGVTTNKAVTLNYTLTGNRIDRVDLTFNTDGLFYAREVLRALRLRSPQHLLLHRFPRLTSLFANGYSGSWIFGYTGAQLTSMRYTQQTQSNAFTVQYNAANLMTGIIQNGTPNWGTHATYNTANTQVLSTYNDTGFPGVPQTTYTY